MVECFNCHQEGHLSSACPEPRRVTCFNCREEGHVSGDCPKPRSVANARCFRCKETGHFASSCPIGDGAQQQGEGAPRKSWKDLTDAEKDSRRTRIKQRLQRRWSKSAVARLPFVERPARRQASAEDGGPVRPEYTHHSAEYNIWYHKKLGNNFERVERMKAGTRCSIPRDSGYTKADMNSSGRDHCYHCLYFARGHCTKGAQCGYFHRVPEFKDSAAIPTTHDVFGRERFKTYRDDMGGIGSFGRNNRTLFIGNFDEEGGVDDALIRKTFAEWGDIEYVRVFWDRCFAFVRYACRAQAEFAKEAMMDQTFNDLAEGKVLSIRWAHEDPNPAAIENERMNILAEVTKAVEAARAQDEELFEYDDESGDEDGDLDAESKKRLDFFPSANGDDTAYPNTDKRYAEREAAPSASAVIVRQFLTDWVKLADLGPPSDGRLSTQVAGPAARPDEASEGRDLEELYRRYSTAMIAGGAFDAATISTTCSSVTRIQAMGIGDEKHASAIASAAEKLRNTLGAGAQASQQEPQNRSQQNQSHATASEPKHAEWKWDANASQWYYTDATGKAVYYDQGANQSVSTSSSAPASAGTGVVSPVSLVDY